MWLCFAGCEKVACESPPAHLTFVLADSAGNYLFDSSSDSRIKITYLKNGNRLTVNDATVYDSFPKYNYVCGSHEMVWLSEQGTKEFFIEYDKRTDVFYFDTFEKQEGRCSHTEVNEAKFNGESLEIQRQTYSFTYVLKRK